MCRPLWSAQPSLVNEHSRADVLAEGSVGLRLALLQGSLEAGLLVGSGSLVAHLLSSLVLIGLLRHCEMFTTIGWKRQGGSTVSRVRECRIVQTAHAGCREREEKRHARQQHKVRSVRVVSTRGSTDEKARTLETDHQRLTWPPQANPISAPVGQAGYLMPLSDSLNRTSGFAF